MFDINIPRKYRIESINTTGTCNRVGRYFGWKIVTNKNIMLIYNRTWTGLPTAGQLASRGHTLFESWKRDVPSHEGQLAALVVTYPKIRGISFFMYLIHILQKVGRINK